MQNIYFLIPVYNEEKVIAQILQALIDHNCLNVVVVNDGSTDQSAREISAFKHVIQINHLINRGQGAALATGLEYLSQKEDCDYIVTFDADGQHSIDNALGMIETLKNNADLDIVMGSRFLEKTSSDIPLMRKLILKLGIVFLRFIYGLRISDAHNGLRAVRKRVAKKIIPKLNDFTHASEIIYLIKMNRLRYQEYPTNIGYSEYSLSKGQRSSNFINIAIKTMVHKINILIFE